MFKRDNMPKAQSKDKKYIKTCPRNKIMNFYVTEEEKEKIEIRMKLSGLTKQEFYVQSMMNQKVVCIGNVKTFDEMKKQLLVIEEHLKNVKEVDDLDENILENLRMILELFHGVRVSCD